MKNEWEKECERLLFDFGRAILGKNAGGMINKLMRERGISGARVVLKMAAEKSDPREYVAAAMKEKPKLEIATKPFVEVGSPQWIAWSKLRRWPETDHIIGSRVKRGWWFKTEWPDGHS